MCYFHSEKENTCTDCSLVPYALGSRFLKKDQASIVCACEHASVSVIVSAHFPVSFAGFLGLFLLAGCFSLAQEGHWTAAMLPLKPGCYQSRIWVPQNRGCNR